MDRGAWKATVHGVVKSWHNYAKDKGTREKTGELVGQNLPSTGGGTEARVRSSHGAIV